MAFKEGDRVITTAHFGNARPGERGTVDEVELGLVAWVMFDDRDPDWVACVALRKLNVLDEIVSALEKNERSMSAGPGA